MNKIILKFKLWRKRVWFSVRYPVNYTHNLKWIQEFSIHLAEVNKLKNRIDGKAKRGI